MSKLSIIFITDDNYSIPTGIAIKSLYTNRDKNNFFEIFIISFKISKKNKSRLMSLSKKKFLVNIMEVDDKNNYKSIKRHREHVSISALFKFDIPNMLPHHEKVLYLDSDVLILDDLKELYDMDFGNNYAVVVKDILSLRKGNHLKRLNFKHTFYFNSGMMLLNLKKMRNDNIPDRLIEYRTSGINHFMDQDAFNVVFDNEVKYCSLRYNLLNFYFSVLTTEKLESFYNEKIYSNVNKNYKNTIILHLGGPEKPWKEMMGYLSLLYLKYAINYSFKISLVIMKSILENYWLRIKNNILTSVYIIKKEKTPKKIFKILKASEKIKSLGLFDEEFYLKKYPDVKHSKITPLCHYIYHGWKEKRIPNKNFDYDFYLKPDVKNSKENPLIHHVLYGKKE